MDALTLHRTWDRERDTPRIRQAFVRLSGEIRRWPQPVDLVAAMPAPPVQKKLAPAANPQRAAEAFTEIRKALGEKVRG